MQVIIFYDMIKSKKGEMSMHYVIGDVHGCYDEMIQLVNKIEEQDKDAIIYFVGDFIDRGPKVMETLTWAMEHISLTGKYRSVRGNHEEMILDWYKNWIFWKEWQKGAEPKTHYDFYEQLKERDLLEKEKLEPIMQFFRNLPYNRLVVVTNDEGNEVHYRIAHAWHYYDNGVSHSQEFKNYFNIWERDYLDNTGSGEVIVHGHTPNLPLTIDVVESNAWGMVNYEKKTTSINVDGGCCYQGVVPQYPCMLCGICLETLETFYPYTLQERFEQFKEKGYILNDSKIEDYEWFSEKAIEQNEKNRKTFKFKTAYQYSNAK